MPIDSSFFPRGQPHYGEKLDMGTACYAVNSSAQYTTVNADGSAVAAVRSDERVITPCAIM